MAALVTNAEAALHIRTDSDADDAWFDMMIPSISQAVLSWLKDDWRAYELIVDSSGDPITDSGGTPFPAQDSSGPIVKNQVKAAVLVELAQQYRFRDGSDAAAVPSHWGYGFVLGAGATSLLSSLRKSTVQ